MNENDFEGSLVLEKLAEHGLLEAFYEAIDDDDFLKAASLMRRAQIDEDSVKLTLLKMKEEGLD